MVELRRHSRVPLDCDVAFFAKGSTGGAVGHAKDVSVGGMFIVTSTPLAFGADVTVHVTLPEQIEALVLPGVVRWVRSGGGMGVQFGLLGARETHAITEYVAKRAE